jgi:hypothetical protein
MKKLIFILLLALSNSAFTQNLQENKKLDEMYSKLLMLNLYNSDKKEEALNIGEKILNNNYGELDLNRTIHLYSIMPSLYISNKKFNEAYNCTLTALKYLQLNRKNLLEKSNISVEQYNETIDRYVLLANSLIKEVNSLKDYPIIEKDEYKKEKYPQSTSNGKSDLTAKESKTIDIDEKTATLIVSGQGKTQEEAKQNALRSAIEQAFGAFISSKTEVLNDKIVSDQITSLSSGNIKSFEIINSIELPSVGFSTTLKAIVSIGKLTSFVQSKGVHVEFKGGLFAMNVKQQLLNERSEMDIVTNVVGNLHNLLQQSFDYSIEAGEPKSTDGGSEMWEVPLMINVMPNKNMDLCAEYVKSNLKSISLSNEEKINYVKLNKPIFELKIKFGNSIDTIFLRTKDARASFERFNNLWFYTHSFYIDNGLKQIREVGIPNIVNQYTYAYKIELNPLFLNGQLDLIPSNSKKYQIKYKYIDRLKLSELEKINSYLIHQDSIRNIFENGGYLIGKQNSTNFHVSAIPPIYIPLKGESMSEIVADLNKDIDSVIRNLNERMLCGYNDWRVPSNKELETFLLNVKSNNYDNLFMGTSSSLNGQVLYGHDRLGLIASDYKLMKDYNNFEPREIKGSTQWFPSENLFDLYENRIEMMNSSNAEEFVPNENNGYSHVLRDGKSTDLWYGKGTVFINKKKFRCVLLLLVR